MRISLLLEREPIGAILEQTLATYWATQYGHTYRVHWQMGQCQPHRQEESQEWLVNSYLNAIFTPKLNAAAFDPIRREFTRSMVWWKRPLQRGYVTLATNRITAKTFAQARLYVSPRLAEADSTLIVAGNHKLRLLNHHQQSVTNLLKIGFGKHFMQREIAVRQMANQCGVPVPQLYDVDDAGGWYTEAYLSGTPINRLADPRTVAHAVQSAVQALQPLYGATKQQGSLAMYLNTLISALQAQLAAHHLLPPATKAVLQKSCRALACQAQESAQEKEQMIDTVVTHGDFQPANILVNRDGVWLIDWEYTARRQYSYDMLVFALAARAPHGLAERLQQFVKSGWPTNALFALPDKLAQHLASRQARRCYSVLFLLENLLLALEETSQPPLTKVGSGLIQLQQEINLWLGTTQ